MASRGSSRSLIAAIILTSLGLLLFLLSFATPNWLESNSSTTQNHFERLGLWEACFKRWTHYKDPTLKEYDGCWYMLSSEFDSVRQYILRSWLVGLQVVLSITLILELSIVLVLIVMLLGILPEKYCFIGLISAGIASLITGILSAISMIVFYVNSLNDLEWINNHEKHSQSWSFWLQLPSVFLMLGGGVAAIVCAFKLRRSFRDRPQAYPQHGNHEMMYRDDYR